MRIGFSICLVSCVLATTQASAQSTIGCDPSSADAYERLAEDTRTYLQALGPNVNVGNYPGDMKPEVEAFAGQRIELYRQLQDFIVATEDFAYGIRRCSRK